MQPSSESLLARVWAEVRPVIKTRYNREAVLANLIALFARESCEPLDDVIRPDWPEGAVAYEMFLSIRHEL